MTKKEIGIESCRVVTRRVDAPSKTPESDAFETDYRKTEIGTSYRAALKLARKLEHERDEAKEKLALANRILVPLKGTHPFLDTEKFQWAACIGRKDFLEKENEQLKRELNEANNCIKGTK